MDPDEKIVALADGERLSYDKALIATGGRNRRLPIPGRELERVIVEWPEGEEQPSDYWLSNLPEDERRERLGHACVPE